MSRAVSIHIGVNEPNDFRRDRLHDSETAAWQMAEVASQARFNSILVLRGREGTLGAVHTALAGASQALQQGDLLFVSFSGHGGKVRDQDGDDGDEYDESWCLHDGALLDDKLSGYWRLFNPGVRIVVVSESCFAGGMSRTGHVHAPGAAPFDSTVRMRGGPAYRGEPAWAAVAVAKAIGTCTAEPPPDSRKIRASVLMLTAASEHQPAQGGLFTRCLLETWSNGAFCGSYCDLYRDVEQRVMRAKSDQQPQILRLGALDPTFLEAPAFRLEGGRAQSPGVRYR